MSRNNEQSKMKKHLCKVNKKWVAVATTSAALLGVGGIFPGIAGASFETETVQAADEESNVSESNWSANTVNEVEQEVEAQDSADTLSYQIRWGDTLSALSAATGVSVDEIALQNDIENADLIYAGDFLSGETNISQSTEEVDRQEASETEKPQAAQAVEEVVEEETIEEQTNETSATETEETTEAVEEVVEEKTIEEQPGEAPAEESEETTEQNASVKDEPVEKPEEEAEETSKEEPVAKIEVPEDADEEVVEEDVPEKIEEEMDVQEVTATKETVEPDDEVVTEQSVAVVTEPESHTETSEGFIQPAQGYLSSGYGYRTNPFSGINRLHAGIDIAGSGSISAAQSGTVVAAEFHSGWGNYVKIDHGNGLETLYAHMERGSIPVSVGDTVSQGQTIGTMGQTGSATGVHLHFEVYVNGVQVDPAPYL